MSDQYNELIEIRRKKLAALHERGNAYPNDFKVNTDIQDINKKYSSLSQEDLDAENKVLLTGMRGWRNCTRAPEAPVQVAGRIKLLRVMGKTTFAHICDSGGALQLYLKRGDEITPEEYDAFKHFDLGDIIGVAGSLYRTQKGELSIKVSRVRLLSKALRPLPDKHKGLVDQEIRYRQRYLDLMVNESSVQVFRARIDILSQIRAYMGSWGFLEVETPMMHPIPGGAAARPFTTHHNALDMTLFLRIAPELYLKRLIVGGFDRVYELNRNFRNEGLSPRHNPEFTMMEFYVAYWDYTDLMFFIEAMLFGVTLTVKKQQKIQCKGTTLDFGAPFARITMREAVLQANAWLSPEDLLDGPTLQKKALDKGYEIPHTPGAALQSLFELTVEKTLLQPTFVTDFPIETSPLARRNNNDPSVADRFELYIMGQEIANGFSELNDPDDQAARFKAQVEAKDAGDEEAMFFDSDYITALEYGMPPAAGAGIGIDRLVMTLLDQENIRDVILFPQMRMR